MPIRSQIVSVDYSADPGQEKNKGGYAYVIMRKPNVAGRKRPSKDSARQDHHWGRTMTITIVEANPGAGQVVPIRPAQ